jgi:hypothetical protein
VCTSTPVHIEQSFRHQHPTWHASISPASYPAHTMASVDVRLVSGGPACQGRTTPSLCHLSPDVSNDFPLELLDLEINTALKWYCTSLPSMIFLG